MIENVKADIQMCLDFIAEDQTFKFDETFWNEYFARKVAGSDTHCGKDACGYE
jgi:hypothetical protein